MKLTKITARNLKGLSFTLDLSAITFLVGGNFAGKTARTDAIRLLLLGYLPELGKLASATFGLASGRDMEVSGEFSDGSRLTRRWYLKGDSVKSETTLPPWLDEKHAELLTVMMNAETYFALSDRGRVDYVFANLSNLGADSEPAAVLATVEQSLGTDAELDREAVERFFAGFRATQAEREANPGQPDWTPQTFLEFSITHASDEQKRLKAQAAAMEKTAQGLAYLRAQEEVAVDSAELNRQEAELTREIEALGKRSAELSAAANQVAQSLKRRMQLENELKVRPSYEAQAVKFRDQLEKLRAELAAVPEATDEQLDQLRAEESEARSAVATHGAWLRDAEAAIARNEKDLADIGAQTKCPYCGATGEGWKTLKESEITSTIAGLTVKRDQLKAHLATITDHAARLSTRYSQCRTYQTVRAAKAKEIQTCETTIAGVQSNLAVMDAKAAELARLPAAGEDLTGDMAKVVRDTAAKKAELDAVRAKLKSIAGRQHDLKRLAEAEKARDDAKQDEAVAKKAAALFREEQARIVAEAFGPLLSTANAFFADVMKTPLAYHQGEIGTWRSGVWVGHRTFSGTEKALAYAAIQAALASRCPVRIMLIDELARLDNANAEKMLAGVAVCLSRGYIDGFVGIDTGRADFYATGGTMHGADLTVIAVQ